MLPDDLGLRRVGLGGKGALPEQITRQRRDRGGDTHYNPPELWVSKRLSKPTHRRANLNDLEARIGSPTATLPSTSPPPLMRCPSLAPFDTSVGTSPIRTIRLRLDFEFPSQLDVEG
jgi:hypothetical protein